MVKQTYSISHSKFLFLGCLWLLSGCQQLDVPKNISQAQSLAQVDGLSLKQTQAQQAESVQQAWLLLQKGPLAQDDAVRLALLNSSALQALLSQYWLDSARLQQSAQMHNPRFSFERLVLADGVDLGRVLSFGLLDLLTLPTRRNLADQQQQQLNLQLALQVVAQVHAVRVAWVDAVAARQQLVYQQQLLDLADASAELAQEMATQGSYSALQKAQQQVFAAEVGNTFQLAKQNESLALTQLQQLLGLNSEQAQLLKLPDQLPEIPSTLQSKQENLGIQQRLDIQLAQEKYNYLAQSRGFRQLVWLSDIELGLIRNSSPEGSQRGFELSVNLPILDWGNVQREQLDAEGLLAANQLEANVRHASLELRRNYQNYLSNWQLARQYTEEILPLRKSILDQNVLRYNGMLIGIFDLLSSSQAQIQSVQAALVAQQQFWRSDALLQASLLGPVNNTGAITLNNKTTEGKAHD